MKIVTVNLNPCIDWVCELPQFIHGGLNRVRLVREDVAGKGINVAVALKNLGHDPLCVGVNFSENGFLLREKLDALNVRHDFIETRGAIRINMKLREETSGAMTEINRHGAFVSQEIQEKLLKKISQHDCENGILVLSGSRPEGVAEDFYAQICKLWRGKIFLDTEGDALKLALETGLPFAIKPNLFELESTFGVTLRGAEEIAIFCREKLLADFSRGETKATPSSNGGVRPRRGKYNLQIVCCSMGERGAVLVTRDDEFFFPALPVSAKGLAGAGDAMVAGMIHALAQNLPHEQFLAYAMSAAAASVILDGTQMCSASGFSDMLRATPSPTSPISAK